MNTQKQSNGFLALFLITGIVATLFVHSLPEKHKCTDVMHETCDGICECDGLGCFSNGIIKSNTYQGLTSVVFIRDGKEWALDFLTASELDSLKKSLTEH